MADTKLDSFPIGAGKILPVDHTGPASYTAGGETIGTLNNLTGIAALGFGSFDSVEGAGGLSLSGNYFVRVQATGTGVRKTMKLLWYNASGGATQPGLPLGLGTLSAAASQSTYTAAGILTVVGANTLKAGQFIVLSNGASSYGLQFSGVMGMVVSATSTGYVVYFGQALANAYTINTDTLKYQVVQVLGQSSNLLQAQPLAAKITGVLATTALLTVTQVNTLQVGQFVYLNGPFKSASYYALGAIVQVASATASSWTANWQGTVINQTSAETAVASLLVTNGGVPVQAFPYADTPVSLITNTLAVAADTTHAGLFTLSSLQAYQPGMIGVVQGVGVNTQLNGSIITVISSSLTQALIKANGWTVIANSQAETAGYVSIITTGGIPSGVGDVTPGTNLSGETVRLAYIGK